MTNHEIVRAILGFLWGVAGYLAFDAMGLPKPINFILVVLIALLFLVF